MPETIDLMSPPVCTYERTIYPLVRILAYSWASGEFISAEPIALLIEEGERWFFVALEDGVTEDCISRIIQE